MKIAVGTETDVKLEAVRFGAVKFFDKAKVVGYRTASGVSDQPMGLQEITLGATNRAEGALKADDEADIGLGLEAGLIEVGSKGALLDQGIVCLLGRNGIQSYAASPGFQIEKAIEERVRRGEELVQAVACTYGETALIDRDCSRLLTDGDLTVVEFYRIPVVEAIRAYLKQVNSYSRS